MGLDRKTSKYLDTASGGSFLHVSANLGRSILDKILENTPYTGIHDEFPEEVEEKLPKEESQIAESKRIASEESSDVSNHSLLIIDTSSFVVFLRKAFSEGSRISS